MGAFGWTKGGDKRTAAGRMTDAPAAIRTGSRNSYLFFMSLDVDMLLTEFRNIFYIYFNIVQGITNIGWSLAFQIPAFKNDGLPP
jgi:hypothetical protein